MKILNYIRKNVQEKIKVIFKSVNLLVDKQLQLLYVSEIESLQIATLH